jgi:hypothetical protein
MFEKLKITSENIIMKWSDPWVIFAVAVGAVLLISLLSKISTGVSTPVSKEALQQTDLILKAANKWALMAQQDSNVVMSLMHICYAKAYVEMLRRILHDNQVAQAHQVNMRDLEEKMNNIEQSALARIAQQAPGLMPEGEFAVRTGWLG